MAIGMMDGGAGGQGCLLGGFGMHGYGWIFQLLILVLLVLIFWWLLRGGRFGYAANTSGRPLDIVKRRYAAGEITKKEHDRLKKELRED